MPLHENNKAVDSGPLLLALSSLDTSDAII